MLKRNIGIFIFLTLFVATSSFAQQEKKVLSLSLEDCILKALENNLGVAIEVLNPELADISVSRAQERFLPSVSLNFNKRETLMRLLFHLLMHLMNTALKQAATQPRSLNSSQQEGASLFYSTAIKPKRIEDSRLSILASAVH